MWAHPSRIYTECQLVMMVMLVIGCIYTNIHLCMLVVVHAYRCPI